MAFLMYVACAVATSCLASGPAAAADVKVNLAKLQALVAGMGLEDLGDKKDYVEFAHHGTYDYDIYLQPYDDGTSVGIFIPLGKIPGDALGKVPSIKMLEFNNAHAPGFVINESEGQRSLYMQHRLPAALATPMGLRTDVDAVIAATDEGADLWDQDKWGGAGDAKAVADAKPAALSVTNVMFVSKPAKGYGMWDKRPSNVFSGDATLLSYAEAHGYTYKKEGDEYHFGFDADVDVRTAKGETLFSKKNFAHVDARSHIANKEFFLDLSLDLKGADPGDYVVTYVLHDINSDQTTAIVQPFVIEAQAAAK